MKVVTKKTITLSVVVLMAIPVLGSDIGTPNTEVLKGIYPGKTYSPYAQRSFPSNVYWGETHLHTGLSLDAGLFGNILGHDDAYRLARGEEIKSSTGLPVKLSRPLDWLVIADHSDMMGIATDIQNGAPNILADPKGKEWHEGFKKGGQAAAEAAEKAAAAELPAAERLAVEQAAAAEAEDDGRRILNRSRPLTRGPGGRRNGA